MAQHVACQDVSVRAAAVFHFSAGQIMSRQALTEVSAKGYYMTLVGDLLWEAFISKEG